MNVNSARPNGRLQTTRMMLAVFAALALLAGACGDDSNGSTRGSRNRLAATRPLWGAERSERRPRLPTAALKMAGIKHKRLRESKLPETYAIRRRGGSSPQRTARR